MDFDKIIEIIGFLVGLAYLYFEYHANRLVWLMSVIMPLFSLWVYYRAGLYADFGINIYYLAIAVYGYVCWSFNLRKKKSRQLPISRMPGRFYLPAVMIFGVIFVALALGLDNYTNSTVSWYDAFTTALSIVGLWMLARKYVEQWIVWFVVDIVCVGLYIYKQIPFYAVLYAVYTVIALFGYRKWLKLMAAQD